MCAGQHAALRAACQHAPADASAFSISAFSLADGETRVAQ